MIHIAKYFHYFLLLMVVLAGCKKLDLTPKDTLSDASFWKKPEDFQLAVNDLYFGLQTTHNYTDRNSDIAFGQGSDAVSNGSYQPAAVSPLWNKSYKDIRTSNYVLQKAEESSIKAELDRWVGEAKFFRAYNYWNLVKTFGGVPLIDKVLDVTSEDLYKPRATQAEIIDFILADLDDAAAKLPKQSELTGDEIGRVTQGAAQSLKARAALYQGTWAKYHNAGDAAKYLAAAVSAAEAVVTSGEYALYTDKGADSYKYLFILEGDDSKEVILARRYYANRATHNWTRELWFHAMTPTKNLADQYLAKDGLPITQSTLFKGYATLTSEFEDRDPRMSMTFVVPGTEVLYEQGQWKATFPAFTGSPSTRTGYMLRKFLDETNDAAEFRGEYDFKEFRYAEVLLILAEALYEKNGQISDADLARTINKIRSRVSMPALTNTFITTNGLNMLNEIRRERTVELAFEGFRREDLRRWKLGETVMPLAIRGVKFKGTEYETRFGTISGLQLDANGFVVAEPAASRQFLPKHYLDPIPLQQIQLSGGTLTQNPGW